LYRTCQYFGESKNHNANNSIPDREIGGLVRSILIGGKRGKRKTENSFSLPPPQRIGFFPEISSILSMKLSGHRYPICGMKIDLAQHSYRVSVEGIVASPVK
jgi:hypothetical protein